MREINEQSLEAAARAVFPQFASAVTGRAPRFGYDNALHPDRELCDELAKDAVAAYLAAERERGYALVPREPTAEMAKVCAGIAKVINPSLRGDAWKAVALDSLAIWRGMFDAAAPIKPSEKEG